MTRNGVGILAGWLCAIAGFAAGPAPIPDTTGWEAHLLFAAGLSNRIETAESTIATAPAGGPGGSPALHWHVDVDHLAGEPKYPIGWPRIVRTLKDPADCDWSGWDYLRLRIRAETSRPALPAGPISLSLRAPDKARSYSRSLGEVRKGEWTDILIPLYKIPYHADVRSMTLSIADASYSHKDRLDVFIADVALVRPGAPVLQEFAPEGSAIWTDARRLPIRFRLLGVPAGGSSRVRFEVRDGGTVLGTDAFTGGRGMHRAVVNLPVLKPGVCTVHALSDAGASIATATMTVVESPWP